MRADSEMVRYVACVVFVAVGLATSIARAEFLVVEDFDSLMLDNIHDQNGWYATAPGEVVKAPDEGMNQALMVTANPGVLHKSARIPSGKSRMLFLRFRFEGQHAYSFGMSHLESPTEISHFGPELRRVSAQDRLEIHNGHTYDVLTELTEKTWYNLWALVDNDLENTQVWLHSRPGDGATAGDQLKNADDLAVFDFRTSTGGDLVKFYIKVATGGSGADPLWIDDIYLEDSDAPNLANPVPEPHSLICLASAAAVLLCCLRRRRRRT